MISETTAIPTWSQVTAKLLLIKPSNIPSPTTKPKDRNKPINYAKDFEEGFRRADTGHAAQKGDYSGEQMDRVMRCIDVKRY